MFEDFSKGYYRADMYVEPYEDGPVVEHGFYEYLDGNCYAQTDADPLFRLGLDAKPYFTVEHESAIPTNVLGLPGEWFEDFGVEYEKRPIDVFICKPEQSYYLQQSMKLRDRMNAEYVEDELDGR